MPPFKDGKLVQDSPDEMRRKLEVIKGIHQKELTKADDAGLQKGKDADDGTTKTTEPDNITPEPKTSFISRFVDSWR